MTSNRKPRSARRRAAGLPSWATPLILTLAAFACLAPFAGKAFHVDDPLFLWCARQIRLHPLDPYRLQVNWYGTAMPFSEVTKNPPLAAYYLAVASKLGGWSEKALHLADLPWAILAVLGTWALGRRLTPRPAFAALAALCTPVFLVSSTNLMCDTMMLALWVWTVWSWIRGLDHKRPAALAASAAALALCGLTKYFGACLVPLLALYTLLRRDARKRDLAWLLIPLLAFTAYQVATARLYGRGLLGDAASYAVQARGLSLRDLPGKLLIGLAFSGGCVAVPLLFAPWTCSRRWLLIGASALLPLLLLFRLLPQIGQSALSDAGRTGWALALQAAVMTVAGVLLLALVTADLRRARSADSALLFAWSAGTFLFAVLINWTINGRSVLPLAPAAGLALARRLPAREGEGKGEDGATPLLRWRPAAWWLLLPAAALGLRVALADSRLAGSARAAARDLSDRFGSPPGLLWFDGHWGFQYYMEQRGCRVIDDHGSRLAVGDRVVVPRNNTDLRLLPLERLKAIESVEEPADPALATVGPGAGFYSDLWGALPFVAGSVAPEQYMVLRVESPIAFAAGRPGSGAPGDSTASPGRGSARDSTATGAEGTSAAPDAIRP